MTSSIGWIDFSSKDKDRVKRFMDMMGSEGVMDELGIGLVRDARSNELFPGFSTLYTRAKYFFITPYILLDRDNKQKKNQSGLQYFKSSEIEVNKVIKEYYTHSENGENESYFGKFKNDGKLKRQPSEVYWNGLIRLKFISSESSLDQMLSNRRSAMEELLSNDRGDDTVKELGESKGNQQENVSYTPDWLDTISKQGLRLTRIEAETLRDRIITHLPHSLLATLLSDNHVWQLYEAASYTYNRKSHLDNPFVHFVETAIDSITDDTVKENLIRAHDLAYLLHGVHVAYNIQLWSAKDASAKFIDELKAKGREWYDSIGSRVIDLDGFDINRCVEYTNVKPYTKEFLKSLIDIVKTSDSWDEAEVQLRRIAENQERKNKGKKSRFNKMDQGDGVDDLDKEEWIGLSLINYRYYSTLSVLKDIFEGLNDN